MASLETGHWFATPFAMLFTFGYGYVAMLVATEELARRGVHGSPLTGDRAERPPPAPSQGDFAEAA